jgi:hypothetical protein
MPNHWYDAQLKSLVGGKITEAGFISSAEFGGEKVPVLVVELENKTFILAAFADSEGNGPGWLSIRST